MPNEKKPKNKCVEYLRHAEYYDMQSTFDELYARSQAGAFQVRDNAKKCADEHPGFSVFDENGKAVYSSVDKKQEEVFRPYLVRVEISDLNIRKKPGTDQEKTGKYTGAGCFTIVAEADGVGASKWGLLKAYEKERNGWISLDYVTKIR